jgi:hypothetical protein
MFHWFPGNKIIQSPPFHTPYPLLIPYSHTGGDCAISFPKNVGINIYVEEEKRIFSKFDHLSEERKNFLILMGCGTQEK